MYYYPSFYHLNFVEEEAENFTPLSYVLTYLTYEGYLTENDIFLESNTRAALDRYVLKTLNFKWRIIQHGNVRSIATYINPVQTIQTIYKFRTSYNICLLTADQWVLL